jgi:glycine dehydrogenase subunit 2
MLTEDASIFKGAPYLAPRRRLDETAAARKPVLSWHEPVAAAAD